MAELLMFNQRTKKMLYQKSPIIHMSGRICYLNRALYWYGIMRFDSSHFEKQDRILMLEKHYKQNLKYYYQERRKGK